MADRVQYRLERMLKELDDLEERKLFTRSELEEIVEKRRRFEYRLERPSPLKKDFIAYIEFETQLDSLRRLRKLRNNDRKKSASDFACVRRIIDLYDRVIARFKGDIELWFRYLEFCRARKNGRIKEVLAKVIRFHPKVPGVWIYAAAWEFDHNSNVTAARSIMQHGLRECRASEDLWIEYLRMELTYLNKLKARKVALGEDKGTLVRHHVDAEEKQWRKDNKELFMSIDEEPVNDDGSESSDGENKELGTNADLFKEQGSNILKTIYRGAVEALSSSFGLRKRFFEILEVIDLAHSEDLKKEILAELKRDFSTDPEYWDWLARLEMSNSGSTHKKGDDNELSRVQKAIQVYEEALQIVPSAMMFKLYTKFLNDFIAPVKGGDEVSRSSEHLAKYISHLLMVYEKADGVDCLTEDLACEYISFYLQQGRVDEARGLAGKLCSGKLSNSVKLWVLRVSIEIRSVTRNAPSPTKADLLTVFELLESVLKKVPLSKAESLWIMALQLFAADKHYFDKLVEMSFLLVAKDGGSDIGFCVSSAIVNFVLLKDGIQNAREIYKRFLSVPRPGLVLYKDCIELEMNLASVGDKDCLTNARKLFESALTTYQQNVSLWRDYYSMETKLGTSDTATAIYWRARKILKDPNAAAAVITQDLP